ncbi:hypothetical protein [Chitinophaga pinensis]|uniref:hypothetical protein n=1 Tax=Chitinophaga pinensis TaxID=79329 RepID=UPI0021BDBE26|nr:hypothetical protein [Chitinophaga pinensis]
MDKRLFLVWPMAACLAVMALVSCTTVKEYQKNRLNDAEMVSGNRKVEKQN